MFCAKCGKEMAGDARFCPACGSAVSGGVQSQTCGTMQMPQPAISAKSRMSYILLGLFLGCLGVHNFYAGYSGRGIAQLLITLLIGWLVLPVFLVWCWSIVEICTVRLDASGARLDV